VEVEELLIKRAEVVLEQELGPLGDRWAALGRLCSTFQNDFLHDQVLKALPMKLGDPNYIQNLIE